MRRGLATLVLRVNDHIIERETFVGLLEFDAENSGARHPAGFSLSEHREQVVRSHLPLEVAAAGP